jgi:hypothetical protein
VSKKATKRKKMNFLKVIGKKVQNVLREAIYSRSSVVRKIKLKRTAISEKFAILHYVLFLLTTQEIETQYMSCKKQVKLGVKYVE